METKSGNGKQKRKAEKGKGRHCNTYNVIVQASYVHARPSKIGARAASLGVHGLE